MIDVDIPPLPQTVSKGKTTYRIDERDVTFVTVSRINSDGVTELYVPRELLDCYARAMLLREVKQAVAEFVARMFGQSQPPRTPR